MKEELEEVLKSVGTEIETVAEKVEEIVEDELKPREDSKFEPSEPPIAPKPHEAEVGELDEHGHLIRLEKAPEWF